MEDSGIDSDPKAVNHVEDERLFLVNVHLDKHIDWWSLLVLHHMEYMILYGNNDMCETKHLVVQECLISYRAVIAVAAATTHKLLSGIQPNSCKKNLVLKQSSSLIYFIARVLL